MANRERICQPTCRLIARLPECLGSLPAPVGFLVFLKTLLGRQLGLSSPLPFLPLMLERHHQPAGAGPQCPIHSSPST